MSKRLVIKLVVTITALSAMTFLQGCGEGEDGLVVRNAWMPAGLSMIQAPLFAPVSSSGAGAASTSQAASGTGGAASIARAAGGGNQVSAGAAVQ